MKFIYLKNENNIFFYRIKYLIFTLLLITIYILYFIYTLQINNFNYYHNLSKKNYTKILPIYPNRGYILDRNYIPIAINKIRYNVSIIPYKIKKQKYLINILKKIFYKNNKIKYNLKIKNNINNKYKKIIIFNNIKFKNLAKYNIYKPLLKNKGIFIKKYFKRNYPFGKILAHVIGYISPENKNRKNNFGKTGIEKYYENILYGKKGYRKIILNNKNKLINSHIIKLPKAGKNIQLSIDIKLQKFIYNLVKNNTASIIITNINNGEVISLISVPSYNPNIFLKKISYKKYNKIINNKNSPLINKIIQGKYPPASTIKPYLAIAALKEKIINKDFKIFDPGWWKLPNSNKIFYDWKKHGHGNINIIKSLEESSDIFFYQISYELGINKILKWIKKFNFGQKTNIDLPNENKTFIPNENWKIKKFNIPWYLGDTIAIGIGQGYLESTPIQINQALIILANKGYIVKPHIIMKNKINKKLHIKNISKKIWNIVKLGMYGVAYKKNGTAYWNFINTNYKLAAKSGTAQVYSINNFKNISKKNKNLKDHILMNVFLPYEKPKYAITIILDHGGNGPTIGTIMRKITDFIIKNKI